MNIKLKIQRVLSTVFYWLGRFFSWRGNKFFHKMNEAGSLIKMSRLSVRCIWWFTRATRLYEKSSQLSSLVSKELDKAIASLDKELAEYEEN